MTEKKAWGGWHFRPPVVSHDELHQMFPDPPESVGPATTIDAECVCCGAEIRVTAPDLCPRCEERTYG